MSVLTGTFPCPLCDHPIHITVTVSTVPVEIDGAPSFTTVTAPTYTHTCTPRGHAAEAAPDG